MFKHYGAGVFINFTDVTCKNSQKRIFSEYSNTVMFRYYSLIFIHCLVNIAAMIWMYGK